MLRPKSQQAPRPNPGSRMVSDRSLNYYPDQVPDIKRRLWQLRVDKVVMGIGPARAAMFLGAALGFLWRRKRMAASLMVLGFLFQRSVKERRQLLPARKGVGDRDDIELEQYALRAQRGDYGKLEVIPFR